MLSCPRVLRGATSDLSLFGRFDHKSYVKDGCLSWLRVFPDRALLTVAVAVAESERAAEQAIRQVDGDGCVTFRLSILC